MGFLVNKWRRIGVRLYLALGFAVALTLVSSAVGVYYFERSGDLSYQVQQEAAPALEASWVALREGERLQVLGQELLTDTDAHFRDVQLAEVSDALGRLETALVSVTLAENLIPDREAVQVAAVDLARVLDELVVNRQAALAANAATAAARDDLNSHSINADSIAAASVLQRMLLANDIAALDTLWDEFPPGSADPVLAALRETVYTARAEQLLIRDRNVELTEDFAVASQALDATMFDLLQKANAASSVALASTLESFDQGRVLLAVICVTSVVAAVITAWLWVGNGVVRRLSRLAERMRNMAGGDLETPVPEVTRDEIGELAGALEVFRQQAFEVLRLNLVEQLYEDLRVANSELETAHTDLRDANGRLQVAYDDLQSAHEELQRLQDRLVAQEKLAALGELVSGVAHEISNPLNFVKNFCEASQELYDELTETLSGYREGMSAEDAALLDEIGQEISDSLNRVHSNGGRALAIVERMRGLGVVGGEPVPTQLHPVLRRAVQAGCDAFAAEWDDFTVTPVFELDDAVDEVMLVAADFSEAMVNLTLNACYAMRQKREGQGDDYTPQLLVTSQQVGNTVAVKVRDNGDGIPEDVLGRVFNPFFSTRDGAYGAGLGLPIAADVARRVGGDLTVDTAPGEFAEFTFTAPVAAQAAAAVAGD